MMHAISEQIPKEIIREARFFSKFFVVFQKFSIFSNQFVPLTPYNIERDFYVT